MTEAIDTRQADSGPEVSRFPRPLRDVLTEAVEHRATDVHIDTWGDTGTVRFRVDGVPVEREMLEIDQARRLINQVKVAADMDIDAARRPLEGQFRWEQGGQIRDIRVTIIPEAPRNESAHLRLLTRPEEWRHMEQLGMRPAQLQAVSRVMQAPHGLVLVAGPTGSGKTTTLYALTELDNLRNLITTSIEDPIEFDLPFVRQLEVDEKRGVTMQEGLRILLRMDADVLMIGEIRDSRSAVVAAQAAMAGRLVVASIHSRDAAGAVLAMRHLGVPSYVLAASLRMVIAQNLVRRLCSACAESREPTPAERHLFEQAAITVPAAVRLSRGCVECGQTGYKGRTGIFQVAAFDESHTAWLAEGPPEHELRQRLIRDGVQTLYGELLQRVADGQISLREAARGAGATGDGIRAAIDPPQGG